MSEVLIGGTASLIAAVITWFFSRKKQSAEVESTELDNVNKATSIWRELAEDLKKQVDDLREGQQRIFEENSLLREEVVKLEKKVHLLTSENKKLRQLIEHRVDADKT